MRPMPIPEQQKREITKSLAEFCEARVPLRVRDLLRLSFRIEPRDVILFEERPQWDNRSIWREHPIAKFRYLSSNEEWRLYWVDQHRRWHEYRPRFAGPDFESLLVEVEKDLTGIFWG